jgi:hypothetical protein
MAARRAWVVIDLGAAYDLGKIKIWNWNWYLNGTTNLSDRGVKQFDVYVRDSVADTTDGTAGGTAINLNNTTYSGWLNVNSVPFNVGTSDKWVLALENQQLAKALNTDTETAQSFSLLGHYGRFVAIVADSHWGGGGIGLGKVRFEDGTGIARQPDPSNGQEGVEIDLTSRIVPGAVSWLAPDDPDILSVFGYNLYMDPNQTRVASATPASADLTYKSLGQTGTDFDPGANLDYETTYYWRVDSLVDLASVPGTDPNTITGAMWSFTTASPDPAPTVVIDTPNTITWVNQPVQLNATVTDTGASPLTITWTSSQDPNTVFSDIHAEDPTVTVNRAFAASPYVVLTCSVQDGANPTPNTDTVVVRVYADACAAARVGAGRAAQYPMDLAPDCVINLEDFAPMAEEWLTDYALTVPIPVP